MKLKFFGEKIPFVLVLETQLFLDSHEIFDEALEYNDMKEFNE